MMKCQPGPPNPLAIIASLTSGNLLELSSAVLACDAKVLSGAVHPRSKPHAVYIINEQSTCRPLHCLWFPPSPATVLLVICCSCNQQFQSYVATPFLLQMVWRQTAFGLLGCYVKGLNVQELSLTVQSQTSSCAHFLTNTAGTCDTVHWACHSFAVLFVEPICLCFVICLSVMALKNSLPTNSWLCCKATQLPPDLCKQTTQTLVSLNTSGIEMSCDMT
jgi:hypothetical protein